MINEKQIAFIICSKEVPYYLECIKYVEELYLPLGYEKEILCVQEADTIAIGYNAAMQSCQAKYKIYLRENAFLINRDFVKQMLEVFQQHEEIGMLGVAGKLALHAKTVFHNKWDVGKLFVCNGTAQEEMVCCDENAGNYTKVQAIGGMIMATQYDIPWREDLLKHWLFYDISHSIEMKRRGYQCAVLNGEMPWCIWENAAEDIQSHEENRNTVIEEYPEILRENTVLEKEDYRDFKLAKEVKNVVTGLADTGAYDQLLMWLEGAKGAGLLDVSLQEMSYMQEIHQLEVCCGQQSRELMGSGSTWLQMSQRYHDIAFLLRRIEWERADTGIEALKEEIHSGELSEDALRIIMCHTARDFKKIEDRLNLVQYRRNVPKPHRPLVSVVVPVYNAGELLKSTIDSILNQTYENLELIMVDDASTDNSRELISSYQDSRIRRIFLEQNGNVCNASNQGFAQAKGTYLALIGHDDIWMPDKLEKQIYFLEKHPEFDVCFTWCDIIDENGNRINETESSLYQRFCFGNDRKELWANRLFQAGNFFCAPTACIRRAVLEEKGYYRYGLVQLQDYELWLRLARASAFYILPEKLAAYRRFTNSGNNLSTWNEATGIRLRRETEYIQDCYLKEMEKEEFLAVFGKDLKNPNAETEVEILCEKAFLLLKVKNSKAIDWFINLLEKTECRTVLKEKYQFKLTDFYKLNSSRL